MMNDFEEEQKNGGYTQNDNSQNNYGTYYTPPKKEEQYQNNAYNYSYNNSSGNEYNSYYSAESGGADGSKPPKKSKAGKIVAIVLVVCVVAAIAGLVASVTGYISYNDKEGTTQSQEKTDDKNDVQTQQSNGVATKDNEGNLTVAGVAESCMKYCVGITVYSKQADVYNYFYGYGQSDSSSSSEPSKSGEGSGVIMKEANGKTYVMTCAHVISDGDSFKVTLNDKTEYDAYLVAYDAQTDIGVLAIDKTGLPVAEFADSNQLVVGEQVVAIGCPGGLEFMNSVTSGYISALDRPVSSSIGYDNKCIQTDAAINPGNSGGALFNMQGQVVGINSSKIASTEYEGMGFAVPSSTAVATANSLIKSGYVEGRAKLGIQYNPLTSFNNSGTILNALEEKGYKDAKGTMVINSIDDESDLKNKDIRQYDMIVAVNGKTMTSTDVMTSKLAESKPGDTIKLTIARIENNEIKIKEIECKLIESKG